MATQDLERNWQTEKLLREQLKNSLTVRHHGWSIWSLIAGLGITLCVGATALVYVWKYKYIVGHAVREIGALAMPILPALAEPMQVIALNQLQGVAGAAAAAA